MVKSRLNEPTLYVGLKRMVKSRLQIQIHTINFPLALVCLSELTILTFSYFIYGGDSPTDNGSNLVCMHYLVTTKVADIINQQSFFMCENIYNRENA